MKTVSVDDFSVDVEKRQVRHMSGVVFSFYCRQTEKDWIESGPAHVRNPSLYDGDYFELAVPAKEAALLHGMKRA
jgi:hypothetical protein